MARVLQTLPVTREGEWFRADGDQRFERAEPNGQALIKGRETDRGGLGQLAIVPDHQILGWRSGHEQRSDNE
jgi:hypothetical protein